MPAFDDDVRRLYCPDDWTQAHDLADDQPDKLRELQRLFLSKPGEYKRAPSRLPPLRALQPRPRFGRPAPVHGTSQLLFGRMGRLPENGRLDEEQVALITAQI